MILWCHYANEAMWMHFRIQFSSIHFNCSAIILCGWPNLYRFANLNFFFLSTLPTIKEYIFLDVLVLCAYSWTNCTNIISKWGRIWIKKWAKTRKMSKKIINFHFSTLTDSVWFSTAVSFEHEQWHQNDTNREKKSPFYI